MITSIYRGGLGNQLFEVITGYFLAKQHNDRYAINTALHKEYGQGNHIRSYENTIFKNFEKTSHQSKNLYKEKQFNYSTIPYQEDLLLDGYFQSEKYFLNKRKEVRELLGYVCDGNTNTCVVHIRTGDYIHQPNFNVVTPKYFQNAVNCVLSQKSDITFKVISDNNQLAKNYLPKELKYEFCSSDDLTDLKTLSECDYAIISNSSFSWWGSYLGKDKVTIVPNRWFNNITYDVSDIYRDDMIKIEI